MPVLCHASALKVEERAGYPGTHSWEEMGQQTLLRLCLRWDTTRAQSAAGTGSAQGEGLCSLNHNFCQCQHHCRYHFHL